MKQFTADPEDTEQAFQRRSCRVLIPALGLQKIQALAKNEGVDFNDEHWEMIAFLRNYYLEHRLPITARIMARVATSTCTGFSVTVQLCKAAGSPICAPPPTPPTFRLAPATETAAHLRCMKPYIGRPEPAQSDMHQNRC